MTQTQTNTPWRAVSTRAKIWHTFKSFTTDSIRKWVGYCRDPRQSLPHLTDKQARDIGLDPADLEFIRMQYPSQTTHHPML